MRANSSVWSGRPGWRRSTSRRRREASRSSPASQSFDALGAVVGAQLGRGGLRRGCAHARTHEGLVPIGIQPLGEQRSVVRQVQAAVFHRLGLAELVHQRRRVVAGHADALAARDHRGDQLFALFDRHIVGRHGVDVRDEHHLVPAQQLDQLAHFLFDLVVRQIALDDAGQQFAVFRRQALVDRILFQRRAPPARRSALAMDQNNRVRARSAKNSLK